ncbi:MAG: hypothetical protein JOS17DRAFT_728150 [Linnemannia elongata]|nr:MAG: hypothetical protein JOS17DRAFT_728150 [Linnemannia elongata]
MNGAVAGFNSCSFVRIWVMIFPLVHCCWLLSRPMLRLYFNWLVFLAHPQPHFSLKLIRRGHILFIHWIIVENTLWMQIVIKKRKQPDSTG